MNGDAERIARGRWWLIGLALLAAAVAFWLPRWWEMRMYRQQEKDVGVGAPVRSGGVTEARKKVDPGRSARDVESALGKPSTESSTAGSSSHAIWTYYYADGTMVINLTDDYVARISVTYGPPRIPTSRRK